MISCGARLAVFDIAELREVTSYDELELDTLGDRKTALFLIMSDTDDSFNFLISMCYTQLFNLLCEKADDVYGGRLPVHVRCLIDECANIGQIPKLEKLVATIRSREISACLVLQAQSQLKAIYKDNADTIIGNMDTSIFLGGKEPTTLKELAAVLGKETIDTYNTGESRGRETSHSLNYQKLGKDVPWVFKSAAAILIVTNTWNIVMGVFDMAQSVVAQAAGIINSDASIDISSVMTDLEPRLMEMDLGPLFGLWFQSLFIGITMWALYICIFIVIYGRMIEIYLVTSVAPVPMAAMMGKEWGGMGQNYLRSLLALGFQAFLIIVCVAIYAVLVQNIALEDDIIMAIWSCVGYTVLLCFTLFKTGSLAKSVFQAH